VTLSGNISPLLNNVSGQLSAGQTITLAGFAPASYNGNWVVGDSTNSTTLPTTNGTGQTVFTVFSSGGAMTCTTCTGNLSIGSNLIAGEHVSIQGSSVLNNNIVGRVCQQATANGVQGDPNCPSAGPTSASFSVVGTSSDQRSNNLGAQTSTLCSSNCGTVYGEIPVIDYGTDFQANQFGMMVRQLTISCQGVPSCVGFRAATDLPPAFVHVRIRQLSSVPSPG
jgi:hypothetical protein